MDPSKDKKPLPEFFERLWGQALVAVGAAEEEASKIATRVAQATGWSPEEVKRQAQQLSERLLAQRQQIEKGVEEGVKKTLNRLKVPRRDELNQLNARLDALSKRLEGLDR